MLFQELPRTTRQQGAAQSFAHVLDRGGMCRAWLRGRENVHKRYLIHVAGFNLGILMRARSDVGPRERPQALETPFCSSFRPMPRWRSR